MRTFLNLNKRTKNGQNFYCCQELYCQSKQDYKSDETFDVIFQYMT